MVPPRYASILGLGFGDCGKGRFVDALTRRWQAHTVVRFNGGAQAGHNVVLEDAHHTFSQFGSGTFTPGVATLLLDPVVIHPTALLVEAAALARVGVVDALPRLSIDGQCRVTTPYHQAAGRLRELLRGSSPHGTCGVGVGETVRHSLLHPGEVLRYRDLASSPRDLLDAIRQRLLNEFREACASGPEAAAELHVLRDDSVGRRWLNTAVVLVRQCPAASEEQLHSRLHAPGTVLFEGAQGILLDEDFGFHPHTTWSSTTPTAVERVAHRFQIRDPIQHLGVIRTYLTRHGAGPFPTWDPALDPLPEPHNTNSGWQGRFRRGHPDAVLLRYAVEAAAGISGLLVSHLDAFRRGLPIRWCESYEGVPRLPVGAPGNLPQQEQLTRLIERARPRYATNPLATAEDLLRRVSSVASLPVLWTSDGPRPSDVHESETQG